MADAILLANAISLHAKVCLYRHDNQGQKAVTCCSESVLYALHANGGGGEGKLTCLKSHSVIYTMYPFLKYQNQ